VNVYSSVDKMWSACHKQQVTYSFHHCAGLFCTYASWALLRINRAVLTRYSPYGGNSKSHSRFIILQGSTAYIKGTFVDIQGSLVDDVGLFCGHARHFLRQAIGCICVSSLYRALWHVFIPVA